MPLMSDQGASRSRLSAALLALFAVAVVVGTVAAYLDFRHKVDDATSAVADDPGRAAPSGSPSDAPTVEPEPVVSLWIGDGYTAGTGADRPETGEACAAATRLGWTCELDAERGTGFLSDGHVFDDSYAALPDRLADLPSSLRPDVVVVDAGRNDLGVFSEPAIEQEMADYVEELRATYPSAVLVQVVPWTLGQEQPLPSMTDTVTRLMSKYDGYVVDPFAEGWAGAGKTDLPALRTEAGASNQPGHDLIGRKLAASIRRLDLPVPTGG